MHGSSIRALEQEFAPVLLAGVGQLLDLGDFQRLSFLLTGRHGSGNPNLLAIVPEQGIVVTLEPEHAAARREREMSVYGSHATFNGDRSASCGRVIVGSRLTGGPLLSERSHRKQQTRHKVPDAHTHLLELRLHYRLCRYGLAPGADRRNGKIEHVSCDVDGAATELRTGGTRLLSSVTGGSLS